jgi:hypothetical protein
VKNLLLGRRRAKAPRVGVVEKSFLRFWRSIGRCGRLKLYVFKRLLGSCSGEDSRTRFEPRADGCGSDAGRIEPMKVLRRLLATTPGGEAERALFRPLKTTAASRDESIGKQISEGSPQSGDKHSVTRTRPSRSTQSPSQFLRFQRSSNTLLPIKHSMKHDEPMAGRDIKAKVES